MAGPEAKVERKVTLDAYEKLGIESVKWGVDGWPDRIFLIPGKPLLIEFKAPGEKPNPRQEWRIKCLKMWGYNVQVHDTADGAFQAIAEALDAARILKKGRKVST